MSACSHKWAKSAEIPVCLTKLKNKNKTSEHYTLTVTVRPLIEQESRWNITHSVVTEYYASSQVKVQKEGF